MPGVMFTTIMLSLGVFTLLYVGFTTQRYAMASLRALREEELLRDT
jgi:hypothetical protein